MPCCNQAERLLAVTFVAELHGLVLGLLSKHLVIYLNHGLLWFQLIAALLKGQYYATKQCQSPQIYRLIFKGGAYTDSLL